jgi:hypothetical protein
VGKINDRPFIGSRSFIIPFLIRIRMLRCMKIAVLGTYLLEKVKIRIGIKQSVPEPYQNEKTDPDPYQSGQQNPDPYQKGLDLQHCCMTGD